MQRHCAYGLSTAAATHTALLPFLLPAFHHATHRRFSTSSPCRSKIGGAPLSFPPEVTYRVIDPPRQNGKREIGRVEPKRKIEITGPRGQITMEIEPFIGLEPDASRDRLALTVSDRKVRNQREMWGTTRAYLQNHILGVSEGHTTILRLVGVGYRASVEPTAVAATPSYPGQQFVSLKVGYSHPIELGVPEGVKASTPQPTRILLEGMHKDVINEFAANIRKWRKPEPYKGKGIFVGDETITLKAKKIK